MRGDAEPVALGVAGGEIAQRVGVVADGAGDFGHVKDGEAEEIERGVLRGEIVVDVSLVAGNLVNVYVAGADADRGDGEGTGGHHALLGRVLALGELMHRFGADDDGDLRARVDGMHDHVGQDGAVVGKFVIDAIGGEALLDFAEPDGGEIDADVAFKIGSRDFASQVGGLHAAFEILAFEAGEDDAALGEQLKKITVGLGLRKRYPPTDDDDDAVIGKDQLLAQAGVQIDVASV